MDDLINYADRGAELKRQPKDRGELAKAFQAVNYFEENLPWVFADLYNKGIELYGEEFAQYLPDVGRSNKTRQNWVYVGTRIPIDERRYKLSFSFYAEVARLVREARDAMLTKAEFYKWTIAQLRREIKGEPKQRSKMVKCPNCGTHFDIYQTKEEEKV
jgi:hypothetical protein